MNESKIVSLLEETLSSIRAVSDEKIGWKTIISLYEKAIENAKNNKYFSTQDALRIYLEFNSNYTADIFKLMEKTAGEIDQYFKRILRSYLEGSVSPNRLEAKIKELVRYSDIYEEFINYILSGEQFNETVPLEVEGYTAKQLTNETILTPLGAFNYLVYLREEPKEALADLKKKLPHRKLFNKVELEEVKKHMDESNTTPVENVEPTAETPSTLEEQATQETPEEIPVVQTELLEKLDAVQQALSELQQTFDDKIAEDTHKNGLFDNMHRELTRYQNGLMDKIVETMAMDIIQLVDSTKGHIRVYEKKEPTEDNYKRLFRVMKGIAEDLEDILYRQSIESYNVAGREVDVKRQRIIQTIPTDDKRKDNLVAVRAAEGYEKDGKIIRPERIKIYKYEPNANEGENK